MTGCQSQDTMQLKGDLQDTVMVRYVHCRTLSRNTHMRRVIHENSIVRGANGKLRHGWVLYRDDINRTDPGDWVSFMGLNDSLTTDWNSMP